CSVDEVGRAVDGRFAEARGIAEDIIVRALATLASQVDVRASGEETSSVLLRFNPSPFEREGVRGLGWSASGHRVVAAGENRPTPLELRFEDGWFHTGDVQFRLVDEADVGDLYNFCPSEEGPASGPERVDARDEGATAVFDGLSVSILASARADERFVRLDL